MLNILIPTYNRDVFLIDNLKLLSEIIYQTKLNDKISIIISDNCSTDDTAKKVEQFISTSELKILFYRQQSNIGLKNNALFVLEKSTGDYVMYLGDDDYISARYLQNCFKQIENDSKLSVIIPNFVPISVEGEELGLPREPVKGIFKYQQGFKCALVNSWKGHQLSGLIFKREGLLESYLANKVDNIYLFIYFVAISCLTGNACFISSDPIKVIQPVKKKDWGYGDDGLMNEIFDNYRKLPVNYFKRSVLEMYNFFKQPNRLFMYKKKGTGNFFKAFYKIQFAPNATIIFSAVFPLIVLFDVARSNARKLLKK